MIKIEENKVLSVVVDEVFAVEYDNHFYLNPVVYFLGDEKKELIDILEVKQEPTIEELKEIALDWHKNHVMESRIVDSVALQEPPTLGQLELNSQNAMVVEINGIKFIIGEEVPNLIIIKDGVIIEEEFQEIFNLSELERYAIKWYYEYEFGIEF